MESKKWERIDFKPQYALILVYIVQSMTTDPSAWLSYTDASTTDLEADEGNLQPKGTPTESQSAAKQDKKELTLAIIEKEKFMLVDSAVFALCNIEQYIVLLASVPGMANDISTALIDYLKLYNSRTQQLILGAGAKVTAGLTNINIKYLALGSQSLFFFISLIPYVRECSSIYDKLIDIMSFRATVCIREMEKIKWDDEDEAQRNVSPHMETLTKEALTLQRVLSKYLPALNVKMIVGRVFVSYEEQWSKAFVRATIRTEAGKARLLRDAELLGTRLGKIDGGEELSAHMINIVTAKQVASGEGIPAPVSTISTAMNWAPTRGVVLESAIYDLNGPATLGATCSVQYRESQNDHLVRLTRNNTDGSWWTREYLDGVVD
ncbi:hypothetical protein PISL3812_06214 [Talaromyces islandicus]|uniref:Vacuolar protein sorting-associated protein 54 C-terminal domain-containing protein n=1 Tax=Talaromyces islandicus TaxID=28573 RepID=A0A0U1M0T0_TALIS|nr:hypothetical protein PISL3812_06214 [Talaromyces islandicus]